MCRSTVRSCSAGRPAVSKATYLACCLSTVRGSKVGRTNVPGSGGMCISKNVVHASPSGGRVALMFATTSGTSNTSTVVDALGGRNVGNNFFFAKRFCRLCPSMIGHLLSRKRFMNDRDCKRLLCVP